MITSAQMRAGRALVRWSAEKLAARAKLGVATVRRAEAADGPPPITEANSEAIHRALEAAGVVFIPAGELVNGGPGVRLGIIAATAEDLTRKIDQLDQQLSKPVEDGPPSPERAIRQMDEARNREMSKRLKARRSKLKSDPS